MSGTDGIFGRMDGHVLKCGHLKHHGQMKTYKQHKKKIPTFQT